MVHIDLDEVVKKSTYEERQTDAWKHVHQPWALDTDEKKKAAYKELLAGDYFATIMNARGVRELMAQGPALSNLMAELKTNPMALEKFILSGQSCGMVAMAALSRDLLRRRAEPPNVPEKKPQTALECKNYAAKLFAVKKWGHAADQYQHAINMVDESPVRLEVTPANECKVSVSVTGRAAQAAEEVAMLPALYANLAACRVKQHRWPEVVGACNAVIKLDPKYTKAYLRRGEAKRRLKDYTGATADGESALAAADNEPEAKQADLKREAQQLVDAVAKEVALREADKKRQDRERNGIELGEGDPIYGMDFDHILRRELRQLLPGPMVWVEEPPDHSEYGLRGRAKGDDPKPRIGMCRCEEELPIDGPEFFVEATIRARGAKRFLYYQIDVAIPWRGICYEVTKTPHWNHDVFRGVARIYNCNHYTDDTDWGMYVTEKPVDPADVPTCTPSGAPIEPLIPLNPDGTVNTDPPKRCNPTQEMLLHKYGPELVKKMRLEVLQAIENLRAYLGEYRALPPAEAEERRAKQEAMKQAEIEKWRNGAPKEVDDDDDDDEAPAKAKAAEVDDDDDGIEEVIIEPTGTIV